MKTRKSLTTIGLAVLAGASLGLPQANATLVSSSVIGSQTGFGDISYTPSTVSEYIIYGRANTGGTYAAPTFSPYIRSASGTHITQGVAGDGVTQYETSGPYSGTYFTYSGGTPTASGTNQYVNFQPVSPAVGWGAGTDPYTWASISASAPAADFTFSFLTHCYMATTDLEVWLGGTRIASYDNVMSAGYLSGGGDGRNTDYFYKFNFAGIAAGANLEFKFTDMQRVDNSSWSNIGILSAALDYTPPADSPLSVSKLKSMPNLTAVPEPASVLGTMGLLASGLLLRRRTKHLR